MFKINFYTSNEHLSKVSSKKTKRRPGIGLLLVKGFVEKMMVKFCQEVKRV
jgi:hypothetical protein